MKTLKIISSVFGLLAFALFAMSFTHSNSARLIHSSSFALPDLRVSQIATPGGLCKGNESKVRVTITNSQAVGVRDKIAVILYVSQKGAKPSSYVGYLDSGIGPNSNYGQPVWFKNVIIPNTGSVTLKAVVNPDQEIQETVYNNNTKIIQAKVAKVCGQTPPPAQGATLTVTAYVDGQWNYSNYTPVSQASVTIVKSGQTYTGTTGSNGKATFPNLPSGTCNITVTRPGYQTATKVFTMSSYNNNTNVAMVPN
jgi:hypothetical protein